MAKRAFHPTLVDGTLTVGGIPLLTGVHADLALEEPAPAHGCFLRARAASPAARWSLPIGTAPRARRWTCTARGEPFWMTPRAGTDCLAIPGETQWLALELDDGRVAMLVPLVDAPMRASLHAKDGAMRLVLESNDPQALASEALALLVSVGEDPYALARASAEAVRARLPRARLRREKPLPAFAEVFGWCTWDAFYQDVSHGKVREGLESLAKAGVAPRMMILDDGWQSERTMPSGERRLTAFAANAKFPGDLGPTVRMAKEEFGIRAFMVWHAFHGYWGGVDAAAMPDYQVREAPRSYSPGILAHGPNFNVEWWGAVIGLVPREAIHRFFHDYHRHLRAQGVDGVKVDNQAATEGVCAGSGGRVRLMEAYREALESSVGLHFGGNLINCMSCANEMFYSAEASTLTRTSTDFWPNTPSSHGAHLYTNAQVGMWFGEFCWPDWDMFQSGHAMGAFHAAGRAVSGAPVYVSDKPQSHDAALLRKLVLHDGTTARALEPGRPTRDCLFRDPTREDVLLKIFSVNPGSGVVGAFNARYASAGAQADIAGELSPADVPGLAGERFAVHAHHGAAMVALGPQERMPIRLAQLTAEVFTIVPIADGSAPIGLIDRFNSGATISAVRRGKGALEVDLRDGGEFACWLKRAPKAVLVDGEAARHSFHPATGLRVRLRRPGPHTVSIRL